MTRLRSVTVSGFRAFTKEATFDLGADVVVLAGPNGSGKTSFFDSILWALSGDLPRFADRKPDIVSLFAPSGHARVELAMEDATGEHIAIVRSVTRGEPAKLSVRTASEQFEGNSADNYIWQRFWPAALQTQDSRAAFCTAFTRSTYLQQDLVREFIEGDSDESRFAVLSELVGAARLAEFLRTLESSRNAWSRTRTAHESAFNDAQTRVRDIETRLERLQEAGESAGIEARWTTWWSSVSELQPQIAIPAFGTVEAVRAVSEALSVLQAERRATERRRRDGAALLSEWSSRLARTNEPRHSIEALRVKQAAIASELETKKQQLSAAQEAAQQERISLTETRERDAELRSLATLALRHVDGETCPVCGQAHEPSKTRHRLEVRLQRDDEPLPLEPEPLSELAAQVAAAETLLADSVLEILRAERAEADQREWEVELKTRLVEMQQEPDSNPAQLDLLLKALADRERVAADLFQEGEQLALVLARSAEAAQRTELRQQLTAAREDVAQRGSALESHQRAGNLASEILDAGRAATREVVDDRMRRIEPLVERIYARMDPHPAFTKIRLGTSYPRGRGRVQALVADPTSGLQDKDPYTLFSSSQLNALAVSIFLGLNLGAAEAPLALAMLDDPLQSLDDVNLLGLVDTLRRTKALRQLILSTHDRRLANLLERKLRPVGDDRATHVYVFDGWTPNEGPAVTQSEVASEPEEIRIVAA